MFMTTRSRIVPWWPLAFVCAEIAQIVVGWMMDDNLHPSRPGRVVSPSTEEAIDWTLANLGPALAVGLMLIVLCFVSSHLLSAVALGLGAVQVALTSGTEGLAAFVVIFTGLMVTSRALTGTASRVLRLGMVMLVLIVFILVFGNEVVG